MSHTTQEPVPRYVIGLEAQQECVFLPATMWVCHVGMGVGQLRLIQYMSHTRAHL